MGSYPVVTAFFRLQTKAVPSSTNSSGTPRPTAIIPTTSGEMESMGGEPTPTSKVLQGSRGRLSPPVELPRPGASRHPPAEEAGAVVEGLPRQAEAHVQPEHLRLCVEGPDQARRGGCSLAALGQRVGVVARCGVLHHWLRLPVRHRLPLEEPHIGAVAERRDPARHLRGHKRVDSHGSAHFLGPTVLDSRRCWCSRATRLLTLNMDGVNSSSIES